VHRKKISRYPAPQRKNTGCQRFNWLLAQETFIWCQARENIHLVPRAGKHSTGAKRGKNIQLVPSAGKHSTGAKRGKTIQLVPSAGKHSSGAKREKTVNRCQARENSQ